MVEPGSPSPTHHFHLSSFRLGCGQMHLPSVLMHLPCTLGSLGQAETLPVKGVLCFLCAASPGAELHRKEQGG